MERRFLVIRLSAIGDVVRTMPAVKGLRERYPRAHIAWLVEDKSSDILVDCPYLDRLIVFPRRQLVGKSGSRMSMRTRARLLTRFVRELRRERFDTVLDFHGLFKSGLLGLLSGAKERIGLHRRYTRELNFLFVNRTVILPGKRINRFERNMSLVELLDAAPSNLDVEIVVPESVKPGVEKILEPFDRGKPLVAIHPTTSQPFKLWDSGNYAKVADKLLTDGVAQVLITCGPGERDAAQQVVAQMQQPPPPLVQTGSLREYAWLVKQADVYFGGDTGPMHIASAMGTPIVALFGPTTPTIDAPYRQPYRALHKDLPCSPCNERRCGRNFECMTAITPEEAYDAILDILEATP